MKNHAALYLRSSKDRKDVSPDAQRRALLELAEQRGLTVVQEFVDAVESGKDENRAGFQSLVRAVRDPQRGWSTVLLYDTSRLSRRRVISLIFEEVDCKQNGVSVVYKTLPDVDPLTEMLLKSILVAWDEYHSILSKQKGLAGMSENVRAGFRAGGRAPTGYRLKKIATGAVREGQAVTKSVLEVDPDVAPRIAAYLRERAAGMPRGRAIEISGVTGISDTSLIAVEWNALTYAGHTVWNVHAERSGGAYVGGQKRRPRSEWVITRDTHEALISDTQAEALLSRLEAKASARPDRVERYRKSKALLTSLVYDPDGQKWWAESDRYRWPGTPERSVRLAHLEDPVIDQVMADLAAPEFAVRLLESTRTALAGDDMRAAARRLRREVAEIAARISKASDMALELEDPAPMLRKVDELEAKRREKVRELEQVDAQAQHLQRIDDVRLEDVQRVLQEIGEAAKENAHSELRASIVSLIERVVLDPRTLEATLTYRVAAPSSGDKLASPRGFEPRSLP